VGESRKGRRSENSRKEGGIVGSGGRRLGVRVCGGEYEGNNEVKEERGKRNKQSARFEWKRRRSG